MEEQSKQTGGISNPFSILTDKLNIRGKLMLAFMVMIMLTLAVIVIATISQQFAKKTVDELVQVHGKIARLSLDTDKTLKIMYGHEKDFLLNYTNIGIQEAKSQYLNKFIAAAGEAYQKLYDIQQIALNQQEKAAAQSAMDATNNYMAAFTNTVTILEHRVDPEFGELAKMQQAVDTLRKSMSTIDSVRVQVLFQNLLYRLQEYILRPEQQTSDKVLADVKAFVDSLKGSPVISSVVQANLLDQISNFTRWFGEEVKTDETIRTRILAYQEAVKQVDPVIQTFLTGAIANEAKAVSRMEQTAGQVQKIVIGVGIAAVLLGLLIAFGLAKGLTRQINHIMDLLGAMGMGDFTARTEVVSSDELGQMATALNAMLDNITVLIQSQEERDAIQESIMKLMVEISDLTQGDLTARAKVTEDTVSYTHLRAH